MRKRTAGLATLVATISLVAAILMAPSTRAEAVVGGEFDPGFIISDSIFFNAGSMSGPQVQTFLNQMLPSCANANGPVCLRYYSESTPDRPRPARGQCLAYPGAANEPAAGIIVKVAQVCGINPQVLLATLQKERGLITKSSPIAADYKVAMGYGCPDTAACDTQYYGFFNQVYRAALQLKTYTVLPNSFTYRVGNVPIQYKPATNCGAPVVNIRNQATANLYNYTPYQPNAAALANLNGVGDGCSSYGNRNFWVYFNNWFGSPTGQVNPRGTVDFIRSTPGQLRVAGWAFDPDTRDPIPVHIYVNGVGTPIQADQPRADVDAAFGGVGASHGFDVTLAAVGAGTQRVCVYGINFGPGANVLFSCTDYHGLNVGPVGTIDDASVVNGQLTVQGWALDPDTVDPVDVHVYADSAPVGVAANQPRGDIAAAFPSYGGAHGYTATMAVGAGRHSICAYGINKSAGSNTLLGCRSVTVADGSPRGSLDVVTTGPAGAVTIAGWAIDPDITGPVVVHAYVDALPTGVVADGPRADIGSAYPAYGPNHGFSTTVIASAGDHTVCAFALEAAGTGSNTLLGCRNIRV